MQNDRAPKTTVRVLHTHRAPLSRPVTVSAGDRIELGPLSEEWPAFVRVTTATGEFGWVPIRNIEHVDGTQGRVVADYNTTELNAEAGELLTVLLADTEVGWLWCRNADRHAGWIPCNRVTEP
ncbi:MAG: SH3 domain-containing protein [Sciscionella sp.]